MRKSRAKTDSSEEKITKLETIGKMLLSLISKFLYEQLYVSESIGILKRNAIHLFGSLVDLAIHIYVFHMQPDQSKAKFMNAFRGCKPLHFLDTCNRLIERNDNNKKMQEFNWKRDKKNIRATAHASNCVGWMRQRGRSLNWTWMNGDGLWDVFICIVLLFLVRGFFA